MVYATTLFSTKTVNGVVSQLMTTEYVTTYPSTTPSASATPTPQSKSFFDSTGKVAGTFTAVAVVIVALVAGIIYCCCFAGGRHDDDDDGYTDEEKSINSFTKPVTYAGKQDSKSTTPPTQTSVSSTPPTGRSLRRSNTGKAILSKLTSSPSTNQSGAAAAAGSGLVGRSLSRRKLKEEYEHDNNKVLENIFPILEHDMRLDPTSLFTMHESNNSGLSFGDDVDYSRKLKVIN